MTGRHVAAAAALLVALAGPAAALEVSLDASRTEVTVGEQFTVAVQVTHGGVGRLPQPELPPVEGFRQISSYSSQNFSYVNGQATTSLTLQYVMVADAEGTYVLGPAIAGSGNDAVRSGTVTIAVKPAGSATTVPRFGGDGEATSGTAGNDIIVLGEVDDETPWVNQQITWTFTFLRRVRLAQGPQYTPPSTTGFWTEELDTSEPREVVLDGRRYVAERVRIALFPTGPGEHTIGEAQLRTTVPDPRRTRRDPFDFFGGGDPFGGFGGREVVLKTDPVTVRVRALPAEGQPEDFGGLVGRFTLAGSVDRTAVKAGEPITFTLKLAGEGNVKGAPAPDLDDLDGFKVYESKADESSRAVDGRIHGEKVWEYVLVPTTGGVTEIPPVRMSVFDPAAGEYRTLATEAVPLDVEATAMDEALARDGDPSLAKERVRLRERDIRYVKPVPGRLSRGDAAPWRDGGLLAAHALPLLLFAGSVALRRQRDRLRSDRRYARRRGAAKSAGKRFDVARTALSGGDLSAAFAATSAALRGYAADRLHLAAANLDEDAVRRGLGEAGFPAEEADALFGMLAACDGARFSPLGSDAAAAAELVERARRWVAEAERR